MMLKNRLLCAAIVATLAGSILGFAPTGFPSIRAQATPASWAQVQNPSGPVDYSDVFMVDQNTAWVAGGDEDTGYAAKIGWDGAIWKPLKQMTLPNMRIGKLSVISDNNIWATGGPTGVMHYNGTEWRSVSTPDVKASYNPIQMLGNGEEGWVGGGIWPGNVNPNRPWRPVILHYKNGAWTQDMSITGESPIRGLHFTVGGGWAVSDTDIWHYQNGVWSREAAPPFCASADCIGGYLGVRAINADEAWAVGWRAASNQSVSQAFAAQRKNGTWSAVLPEQPILDAPVDPLFAAILNGVTFTGPNNGWAVGLYASRTDSGFHRPLIIQYKDGAWHSETLPDVQPPVSAQSSLSAVSAVDADHALAVGTTGVIFSYGYGSPPPAPNPTSTPNPAPAATPRPPVGRVPDPHRPGTMYFPLVGHTLSGGFLDYWQKHGGLEQFGYPLTEEYTEIAPTDGKPYTTQWFERARMEWHPENRPPYDILLGLLGRETTKGRESEPAFKAVSPPFVPSSLYFSATGHNLAPEFATYWQEHGGLPVYGYPISEPFIETSKTDGEPYLVQYFERNRLEYHPENDPPYRVLLGLLGVDTLHARGLLP